MANDQQVTIFSSSGTGGVVPSVVVAAVPDTAQGGIVLLQGSAAPVASACLTTDLNVQTSPLGVVTPLLSRGLVLSAASNSAVTVQVGLLVPLKDASCNTLPSQGSGSSILSMLRDASVRKLAALTPAEARAKMITFRLTPDDGAGGDNGLAMFGAVTALQHTTSADNGVGLVSISATLSGVEID